MKKKYSSKLGFVKPPFLIAPIPTLKDCNIFFRSYPEENKYSEALVNTRVFHLPKINFFELLSIEK